jgi:hypothetical protein
MLTLDYDITLRNVTDEISHDNVKREITCTKRKTRKHINTSKLNSTCTSGHPPLHQPASAEVHHTTRKL